MQQFLSSINFCLSNIGYLFILCIPVITLEVALGNLIASIDIQTGSDSATLEAIGEIFYQFFMLVIISLVLSVALSGGCMVAFHSLSNKNLIISEYPLILNYHYKEGQSKMRVTKNILLTLKLIFVKKIFN